MANGSCVPSPGQRHNLKHSWQQLQAPSSSAINNSHMFLHAILSMQAARDLSRLSERNQPCASEPFHSQQPLLLLPPIFSKQDMPVVFAFRDQPPPKGEGPA
jgi:hypothetical protein